MGAGDTGIREGSLQAPSRHPLDWRSAEFVDEAALEKELERVFDICHGCRRCFSLCNSFPTLFDAIDASPTLELDGVDKKVYWDVVDHCYLCDMCFMTKCPYVPPHPWNIDFPHLMLRAKHVQHRKGEHSFRDKVLSNTRGLGSIAGIPVVAEIVNAVNGTNAGRQLLEIEPSCCGKMFRLEFQVRFPADARRGEAQRIDRTGFRLFADFAKVTASVIGLLRVERHLAEHVVRPRCAIFAFGRWAREQRFPSLLRRIGIVAVVGNCTAVVVCEFTRKLGRCWR